MFSFLRSRLRFAGRIGWVDGRRGYPAEDQFVELPLHRPGGASPVTSRRTPEELSDDDQAIPSAAVRPLASPRG